MPEANHLFCLTSDYLDELKAEIGMMDIDAVYGGATVEIEKSRLVPTPIVRVGPSPNLLEEDGTTAPEHDHKCAILIHKHLPNMTSAQGGDERLWAYLTHTDFNEYTKARWGFQRGGDRVKHVRNRWFMRGGRQGLLGNSIARLWWAAHLTHAPWDSDPYFKSLGEKHKDAYVFTRLLFNNQNMFQSSVARRFSSSSHVRICMLEAFDRRAKDFANLSGLSEVVYRRINLVCSYRVLSALPFEALMAVMEEHVEQAKAAMIA